jgi:hypothetical protein
MNELGKVLLLMGLSLFLLGLLMLYIDKLPFGLGRLPGDIIIRKDSLTIYIPIATSLLVSILLSLLFAFIKRL